MSDIQVLIADDDPLVRVALAHFVSADPDIKVVGQCSDGHEAVAQADKLHPDVIMMDVHMPEMDGIHATEIIKSNSPDVHVLAVTTLDTGDTVFPMLGAGATGYILKDTCAQEIVSAVKLAAVGEGALSPRIASLLVAHSYNKPVTPIESVP